MSSQSEFLGSALKQATDFKSIFASTDIIKVKQVLDKKAKDPNVVIIDEAKQEQEFKGYKFLNKTNIQIMSPD
jgi:hypothetical protein